MFKNILLVLFLVILTAGIILFILYRDSVNLGELLEYIRQGKVDFSDIRERLVVREEVKMQSAVPPELNIDARKSKTELDVLLEYARKNNINLNKDIETALQRQDFIKANILVKNLLFDRVISWKKLFIVQGIYSPETVNKENLRRDIQLLINEVRNKKNINTVTADLVRKYPEGIITTSTVDRYLCDSNELATTEALKNAATSLKLEEISDIIEKEGQSFVAIYVMDGNTSDYCNFSVFLSGIK